MAGVNVSVSEIEHDATWLEEVRNLIEAGDTITAIKLFRERTGLGLKEAKDAVEAIQTGTSRITFVSSKTISLNGDDIERAIVPLLKAGHFIDAVKFYRVQSGLRLKDSKQAVDAIVARHGLHNQAKVIQISGLGCLIFLAIAAGVAMGLVYLVSR